MFAIAFILPQPALTRYGYFDVNNGWRKIEWSCFGLPYKRTIEVTRYSSLLKKLGLGDLPPDWKMATQEEFCFGPHLIGRRYVDYAEGSIQAGSERFAMEVELKGLDKAKTREWVDHFQILIRTGNASDVKQYLLSLGDEK